MSGFEKFKEELSSKVKFYSFLIGKKFTDKDYEHVLKVWNTYEVKTIKDYLDLYLKCDILLLADVFEKIKNKGLKNYGLWSSHYFSAPGLSWDSMLNKTEVEAELISDVGMY